MIFVREQKYLYGFMKTCLSNRRVRFSLCRYMAGRPMHAPLLPQPQDMGEIVVESSNARPSPIISIYTFHDKDMRYRSDAFRCTSQQAREIWGQRKIGQRSCLTVRKCLLVGFCLKSLQNKIIFLVALIGRRNFYGCKKNLWGALLPMPCQGKIRMCAGVSGDLPLGDGASRYGLASGTQ